MRHWRPISGELVVQTGNYQHQNELTDAAIDDMVHGFLMFNSAERIIICNDRYIEMYGLSRDIVKPGCSFLTLLKHRAATGLLKLDPISIAPIFFRSCPRAQSSVEHHHHRWA